MISPDTSHQCSPHSSPQRKATAYFPLAGVGACIFRVTLVGSAGGEQEEEEQGNKVETPSHAPTACPLVCIYLVLVAVAPEPERGTEGGCSNR